MNQTGNSNHNTKLTNEEALRIFELCKTMGNKEVSELDECRIGHSAISCIRLGKTWSHVTGKEYIKTAIIPRICKTCGKVVQVRRRFCNDECRTNGHGGNPDTWKVASQTKRDLKEQFPNNWTRQRVSMTKHARGVILNSEKKRSCQVCGYDRYVETCHVKDVSEFGDDIEVRVINHIDNLVYLCPNHHKEFDKKLMDESDIRKIHKTN